MVNNTSMVSFNQLARTALQADTSPAADALRALTRSWTADNKAVLGSVSGARAGG